MRILAFVAVLLFAVVSGRWPSEHLLPWIVRLAGTLVTIAGAVVLVLVPRWGAFSERVQRQVGAMGRFWAAALARLT